MEAWAAIRYSLDLTRYAPRRAGSMFRGGLYQGKCCIRLLPMVASAANCQATRNR